MTTEYSRNVLKLVVAQICQTIGWHSINSTPLEFLVDLMQEYILQLSKLTQGYAQCLGRSEANLNDLGLAFLNMNIDVQDLAEYVRNVDSVPCAIAVPKLPIKRENHLNFLKPGSQEVVTRPVHVHEHLPPMYPSTEDEYQAETRQAEVANPATINELTNTSEDDSNEVNIVTTNGIKQEESPNNATSQQAVFKRPGDPISFDGPILKRVKNTEEGRPLREIHSVIMTTSGFLSTAREGKLPEARTPQQARAESPPPPSYPMVPPEVKIEKKLKKIPKKVSSGLDDIKPENKENKKKKFPKDILFKPDEIKDVKVVKLAGTKEIAKLKALKPASKTGSSNLAGPSNAAISAKNKVLAESPKHAKTIIPVNNVKTEIIDVTQNTESVTMNDRNIDKLPIEPDKQKLNIFKKISSSKSKEEKEKEFHSHENSPSSAINDNERIRNDIVVKQEDKKFIVQNQVINNNVVRAPAAEDSATDMMSPRSDIYMFEDMSPPGTPSTPKTPELNVSNIPGEQKKKRKDKTGKKKEPKPKISRLSISPKKVRLSNELTDLNTLDRPKTPQAFEHPPTRDLNLPPSLPFPFFPPFPASPGLIPHPMFPLPLPKGLSAMVRPPNPVAVMPGMLRPRFYRPTLDVNKPLVPPSFVGESFQPPGPVFPLKQQPQPQPQSLQSPQITLEKPRMLKSPEKELLSLKHSHLPFLSTELLSPSVVNIGGSLGLPLAPTAIPPVVPAPLLPQNVPLDKPFKPEKAEKTEKKSKEHKKEKKEKMKKKKEKKEKHKEKGEKLKEKKDKSEKKEKLEKIKEKKEKKEKRKEKETSKKLTKEEKVVESVPKITLKLGPAGDSPRPTTPDCALMKKITIKPPKKPEDEVKREPTPELARISALVTRPPKQKSTKAKAEAVPKKEDTKEDKENGGNALTSKASVTVDPSGRQVWICPACGKQDDGSPMIGCDDCDAWYHWVCVGIQVEPAVNENWYCRLCLAKKQEQYNDKKKKKRKKVKATA